MASKTSKVAAERLRGSGQALATIAADLRAIHKRQPEWEWIGDVVAALASVPQVCEIQADHPDKELIFVEGGVVV